MENPLRLERMMRWMVRDGFRSPRESLYDRAGPLTMACVFMSDVLSVDSPALGKTSQAWQCLVHDLSRYDGQVVSGSWTRGVRTS
jgi:hypothetical protein